MSSNDGLFLKHSNRLIYHTNSITKIMKDKELSFYLKALKLGITPNIINIKDNNVTMERYDKTYGLLSDDEKCKYYKDIDNMIEILHNNGILHGDLHSYNIVINTKNSCVKIIDFEMANNIEHIDDNECKSLADIWYYSHNFPSICNNVSELIKMEKILYKIQ